ncbi:MAG: radical SAM protein [bacterium]
MNKTLNLIEQKQQLAVSYAHPYRMYLEMTRNCNLRCRICCQSIVDIDRPEITPELIRKLSPLIPYCESVAVYGFGESLAAPHFFDYMRQLPFDNNQTVLLTTNGTLLSPDKSRLILDSPINMLGISLDAANPDTYEYIRGKRLWQQIIDNIKYFNQLKQERGQSKPTLRFDFVALRKNIEELPNFVRLAKELHAEHIDVGYMNTYREELREQSLFFYQELSDRIFSEAKQIATQLGIDLHLPPMFHPENQPNPGNNGAPLKHSECREPWQFIQICADGSVIPCWNTSKPLGNLNDDTFETIWNNPAFQEFRQYLNSNKEMYRCRYCLDYRFRNIHNINHHILVLEKS